MKGVNMLSFIFGLFVGVVATIIFVLALRKASGKCPYHDDAAPCDFATSFVTNLIQLSKFNTEEMAKYYAALIMSHLNILNGKLNWVEINNTIKTRWSNYGLNYIKHKAWEIVEGEKK